MLKANGLEAYFLVPRINWLPKSRNIVAITNDLGISCDAVAFVDDDRFEREQVSFMLPEVVTIASEDAGQLPNRAEFSPSHVTREAGRRRDFYRSDMVRKEAERQSASREGFLSSCEMRLCIRPMKGGDIPRVQELMTRTHQLNTSGLMLDEAELTHLFSRTNGPLNLFVAELNDRFGEYGIVGTAMIDPAPPRWRLKYLAVSCRVMGRGIERAILSTLVSKGIRDGYKIIEASFRDTGRNRMMRALYQKMGFREKPRIEKDQTIVLAADPGGIPNIPRWITIV